MSDTNLEHALSECRRYRLALESLTPGGSEFFENPQRCVEHIRERFESGDEAKKELARLRRFPWSEEAERPDVEEWLCAVRDWLNRPSNGGDVSEAEAWEWADCTLKLAEHIQKLEFRVARLHPRHRPQG